VRTQARGKWMIPAYKVILFTSIGSSMYMMGRMVLVSYSCSCRSVRLLTMADRDTRLGSARTRVDEDHEEVLLRKAGKLRRVLWLLHCTNKLQRRHSVDSHLSKYQDGAPSPPVNAVMTEMGRCYAPYQIVCRDQNEALYRAIRVQLSVQSIILSSV
jgi:hypothetical protein